MSQIAVDDVWSALRAKRDVALSKARTARGAFAPKPKKSAARPATRRPATKRPVTKKETTKKR